MSEPDETMIEAVAVEIAQGRNRFPNYPPIVTPMDVDAARAVLSVPVVRDALARDAQVREIVGQVDNHPPSVPEAYRSNSGLFVRIYRLYAPSPGDRDDSKEQK